MNITDEMVNLAAEAGFLSGTRAGLEAVAPLIAAQALREAAKEIRAAADGATDLANRHDGPGVHAFATGLHDAADRLGKMAAP